MERERGGLDHGRGGRGYSRGLHRTQAQSHGENGEVGGADSAKELWESTSFYQGHTLIGHKLQRSHRGDQVRAAAVQREMEGAGEGHRPRVF